MDLEWTGRRRDRLRGGTKLDGDKKKVEIRNRGKA